MLNAYIVDDELLAVDRLTRLLQQTGRVRVVGNETNPEAALAYLQDHADIDVLFLDIEMPALNGFELLERLGRDLPVVFTTAYDRYAVDAFTVSSVDYLLKPVEAERLEKTIDKLGRPTASRPDLRALARELAEQLAPKRRLDRLASRVGEKTTLVDVARITHFVARDKLTIAHADDREHVVDMTLTELESRLDSRRFVRVHRAAIVQLSFIQELYPGVDGVLIRLKDGARTELPVARDRVRLLKERLGI